MGGQDLAARGTQVRSQRAALKQAIAAGTVDVVHLLRGNLPEQESIALGMPVRQLLEAVPGIGPETAGDLVGEYFLRALGGMTIWSRRLLADRLEARLDAR